MRFSIIIPTRNRPGPLDRCLKAIAAVDYPHSDFEILVVDDGSHTPLDELIAYHAARLPLRYFRNHDQGPARARNHALRHARGEYVVFTDDDCLPRTDWLRAYDRAFYLHPGACLGGGVVGFPEDGIFGVASQTLISFLYEYNRTASTLSGFFCSNNLAFGRAALLDLGGFEEAFPLAAAEDRDLCARWAARGELHFVPEAVVEHRQDLNAVSFCAQHFRYGRGAFQFWSRRCAEGHAGRRLAPWGFYRRMLLYPFPRTSLTRALAISALLALSQAFGAAGYFAERLKGSSLASPVTRESEN